MKQQMTYEELQNKIGKLESQLSRLQETESLLKERERRYIALAQIGLALSFETNINKLLDMIVAEARKLSNADAGTLYLFNEEHDQLQVEVMQNDSMSNIKELPDVPLYKGYKPNYSNVSSYCFFTGEVINIPDLNHCKSGFTGPCRYDEITGYISKSMLVLPIKNYTNEIVGILQLLNAKDPNTKTIIPFDEKYLDILSALASQAGIALINVKMNENLNKLLDAFIESIATAIDEKSPYTGGHIRRVVNLAMLIAKNINETDTQPFQDINFTEDEIEEIRIAAWLHDVGKITTPEYIMDKATRLETLYDRIDLIETRFQLIEYIIKYKYINHKNELMRQGKYNSLGILDSELSSKLKYIKDNIKFIKKCNTASFVSDDDTEKLKEIASHSYFIDDTRYPYLTFDELRNLCITRGTLLEEERKIIENHVTMTMKITEPLPFPKRLKNVPKYASNHHEKLDGSGYHQGLNSNELSLQSRIIAIADIFEALTAKDRPYRKPMKLSKALEIMEEMKNQNHIDKDIYNIFINHKLYKEYIKKEYPKE